MKINMLEKYVGHVNLDDHVILAFTPTLKGKLILVVFTNPDYKEEL
jgi:hypothetical protein